MSAATRVVVLGGGVAGLEVATALGGRQNVTLVDRSPVHFWKPALHEFAAGTMAHANNCIPFVESAGKFGFKFVQSTPESINRTNRTVSLTDGSVLSYDYLVVALGSRANDFGIPGVADHCLFIDSLTEADGLHARFREDIRTAKTTGEKIRLGIVGGGATGVQLIAELCKAIDTAPGFGVGARRSLLDAVLIETGPRILPAFPESVSHQAAAELESLGVRVRTGCMVVSVDEQGFTLKTEERIPSTLRIWAAGVKASDATALFEGLDRGRSGQLTVTETLQTTNDPHVLALGDCSRIEAAPLMPTAQVARQEGEYVGKILPLLANGHSPAPFTYRDRGAVVALGDYNGWGMLDAKRSFGGGRLTGLGARLIHEGLYRRHQAGILGLRRTVCTLLSERLSPAKPDLGS